MFGSCYDAPADGSLVLIFPEGVTQDDPHLAPVKTGAARIALGARAAGVAGITILPVVGIHYENKAAFRSRVLVASGEPIDLDDVAPTLNPDGGAGDGRQPRRRHVADRADLHRDALRGTGLPRLGPRTVLDAVLTVLLIPYAIVGALAVAVPYLLVRPTRLIPAAPAVRATILPIVACWHSSPSGRGSRSVSPHAKALRAERSSPFCSQPSLAPPCWSPNGPCCCGGPCDAGPPRGAEGCPYGSPGSSVTTCSWPCARPCEAATDRSRVAGPGSLPRAAHHRAPGATPALGQADRPTRRLQDGATHRQDRVDPPAHQHSLRHAAITNALDPGVPLRDGQILARHADPGPPSTTTEPAATSTATASTSSPPTSPAYRRVARRRQFRPERRS